LASALAASMRWGRPLKSLALKRVSMRAPVAACTERSPGTMIVSPWMRAGPWFGKLNSGVLLIEGVCEAQPAITVASVNPEIQPNVRFAAI